MISLTPPVIIILFMIIFVLVAVVIAILLSNSYSVLKKSNKDVILLDDKIIEKTQQNFREQIIPYKKEIQLLSLNEINEFFQIKLDEEQINSKLNKLMSVVQDNVNKSISDAIKNIKVPSIKPLELNIELPEQTVKTTRFKKKTLYDIVPDKYIDLLKKELNNLTYNNGIIKYFGNITIILNTTNSDEFWYLDVIKETSVRYSFNIKQKKEIFDIVNYIYFLKNKPVSPSSFNFIKKHLSES